MDKKLCVAYASDDNYAKYLGISLLSLLKTNKEFEKIDIFILDCGIKNDNKERLISVVKGYRREIHFISMKEAVSSLELNMGKRKISIASYARLFLSSVIPDTCSKILYLDCDTIVCKNLSGFWNVQLEKHMLAGVRDTVDRYFLRKIGLMSDDYYINAGIILVNLDAWRKNNIKKQFIKFIIKHGGNVPHHDQGTINAVCNKEILIVHPKYNVTSNIYTFSAKTIKRMYNLKDFYPQKDLDKAKKSPVIIHYTTGLVGRPWEENCSHPMKEKYIEFADNSPWKDDYIMLDSRSLSVKVFAILFRYGPPWLSESVYRLGKWMLH